MHKVDSSGATAQNEFTNGNPSLSIARTRLEAKFMNTVQRELVRVVEQAGNTLSDTEDTQLARSVVLMTIGGAAGMRALPIPVLPNGGTVLILEVGTLNRLYAWDAASAVADNATTVLQPASNPATGRWIAKSLRDVAAVTNSLQLSTAGLLQLVNDAASPGAYRLYGTTALGAKGWQQLPGMRGALVTLLSNTAIANNTGTILDFANEVYNLDSIHNNGANPSRLTVPTGVTRVKLSCGLQWVVSFTGVNATATLMLYRNGAQALTPGFQDESAVSSTVSAAPALQISTPPLTVAPGEYFEFRVFQNSGASQTLQANRCWAAMEVVG